MRFGECLEISALSLALFALVYSGINWFLMSGTNAFFTSGPNLLESAFMNISKWGRVSSGKRF